MWLRRPSKCWLILLVYYNIFKISNLKLWLHTQVHLKYFPQSLFIPLCHSILLISILTIWNYPTYLFRCLLSVSPTRIQAPGEQGPVLLCLLQHLAECLPYNRQSINIWIHESAVIQSFQSCKSVGIGLQHRDLACGLLRELPCLKAFNLLCYVDTYVEIIQG